MVVFILGLVVGFVIGPVLKSCLDRAKEIFAEVKDKIDPPK